MEITQTQMDVNITVVRSITALDSCCKSYLLARGRCYTCPGLEFGKGGDDDDDDDGHDDDFEEEE